MIAAPISGWEPYCGAAPLPADWLLRWNLDPWLLVAMGIVAALLWRGSLGSGVRRQATVGILMVAAILFVSPFCALTSALFTARVVHHVILATVLAPLLVFAAPGRFERVPGSLPVWTALHALVFWAWHAPPFYAAALSSDIVYWAMQASIAGSAAVWWAKVLRAPAAGSVAALLAQMMLMGVLGALITFAPRALYAPHWLTTQAWGMSPLEDQQLAGIVMWAPASAIYLLGALAILYRAIGPSRASA